MKQKDYGLSDSFRKLSEFIDYNNRNLLRNINLEIIDNINSSTKPLRQLLESHRRMMSELAPRLFIPETQLFDLSRFQLNVLTQISNSKTTEMLDALKRSIINTEYVEFNEVLNQTLSKKYISAADFGMIKTFKSEKLIETKSLPVGMTTAMNDLHKSTSLRIASIPSIMYETDTRKFFVNAKKENKLSSTEMNVIGSAMDLIEDAVDDEFITEIELMTFLTVLEEQRNYASQHPTGIKITEIIRDVLKKIDFDCEYYYHSRALDENNCPYTSRDMQTAPNRLTGPGRYNHPGLAFYYFADSLDGSKKEVKKHSTKKEIQTAKIRPNRSISMLDLSGHMRRGNTFLKYIRFEASGNLPREYLLPCFVSDCCRFIGIEGIKYYGSSEYNNYVTWHANYFDLIEMI